MTNADRSLSDDVNEALKALGIARTRDQRVAESLRLLRSMEGDRQRLGDGEAPAPSDGPSAPAK